MADFLSAFPAASSPAGTPPSSPAAAPAAVPDFLDAFPAAALTAAAPAAASAPAAPVAPITAGQQFTQGVMDPINGGAQLLAHAAGPLANAVNSATGYVNSLPVIGPITKALGMTPATAQQVDQSIAQNEQQYQAGRAAAGESGWDPLRLAGQAVALAPISSIGPLSSSLGLGGRIALGASQGAATSALTPITDPAQQTDYGKNALANAALGGAGGAVINPLVSLAGGVISPRVSAAARNMLDRGVPLTPGQILGGAAATTESKATSIPVVGDMIRNSQQRAVQGFNRATYQEALAPVGAAVPDHVPTGSDAIDYVRNAIGHVYDSIAPRATFVADANFSNDLNAIRNNLAQTAPAALPQFDNVVNNQVTAKLAGGVPAAQGGLPVGGALDGAQWANTRSTINTIARNRTLGNATPDDRELSGALGDLNDAISAGVGRSSPPDVLTDLANANAAYARYKQIEAAAGMAGASNQGNIFTAAQFNNAVRKGSTLSQKATNSGLSAQLGADAQTVLGAQYPNSGTAGREALIAMLTGGAGVGGLLKAPVPTLATVAGLGAASLPYTQWGNALARAALVNRPGFAAPLGRAVTNAGPLAGNAILQLLRGAQ